MNLEPWGIVDELVVAAGGRDEQIHRAVTRAGAGEVADLLAAEIGIRGNLVRRLDHELDLVIGHEGEQYSYRIAGVDGRLQVAPGRAERGRALAEVRYALTDLVRLVYPHRPGLTATSREVRDQRWPWVEAEADPARSDEAARLRATDPERAFASVVEENTAVLRATQAVIAACSSPPVGLDELATLYGSDKWAGLHWYTPHYETHLGPLRYDPVKILEIGIGGYHWENLGGQSLHMWQHYFPRGLVYGLDLFAKPGVTGPRIRTIQGDQNDPGFLRELAAEHGPFDVIVDDGSHINEHVRTSFEALFTHVRPGGWYVIEDLQTSYWPSLGGEPPPGSANTSMGLLKDLLDGVHISEHTTDDDMVAPPTVPAQVSVHHGLAFLRRVGAHERGVPGWFQNREADVRTT